MASCCLLSSNFFKTEYTEYVSHESQSNHFVQAPFSFNSTLCKLKAFVIIMLNLDIEGHPFIMKKRGENKSSKLPLIILGIAVIVIVVASVLLARGFGTNPVSQVAETSQLITPIDYQQDFGESAAHVLIDVRTPEEFDSGHIRNAINISVEILPDRLNEVPSDLPIVVYCRSGNRSATAAQILVSAGYQSVYDLGGIQTWVAQGLPVEY